MSTITAIPLSNSSEAQSAISWAWPSVHWQSFVGIVLFLSIWFSAFAVIYTTYSTRHTFAEIQKTHQQHDYLFAEWTQLLLEQSAWTDASTIQQIADTELDMFFPLTENIQFLVISQ